MTLYDLAAPFVLAVSILIAIPTFDASGYRTQSYQWEFPALSPADARHVLDQLTREVVYPSAAQVHATLYWVDPLTKVRKEVPMEGKSGRDRLDLYIIP